MTPLTLIIDRRFRGVGRIKLRTGTTIPAVRRKMNRMLTQLAEEKRLDILRQIRDRKLTLDQVYAAFQKHALDSLPTAETSVLLSTEMQKWIDGLTVGTDCSKGHKISLGQSRKYLIKPDPKSQVADLPAVLQSIRSTLGKTHPRSFNLARSAALAFARDTLKKNHPIYMACAAVEPRRVPKTKKRHPLTLKEMRDLFPNPKEDNVDKIAWDMVMTGMHQDEYWGTWSVETDRIHIEGTKREGRSRDVPLVRVPSAPSMHRRTFEDKVRARTSKMTPYDLRRTFANWMESAGIPRTRRKLYMGHGAGDVTDLYEWHEVAAFLVEDGRRLRDYLDLNQAEADRQIALVGA